MWELNETVNVKGRYPPKEHLKIISWGFTVTWIKKVTGLVKHFWDSTVFFNLKKTLEGSVNKADKALFLLSHWIIGIIKNYVEISNCLFITHQYCKFEHAWAYF